MVQTTRGMGRKHNLDDLKLSFLLNKLYFSLFYEQREMGLASIPMISGWFSNVVNRTQEGMVFRVCEIYIFFVKHNNGRDK